MKDVQCLLRYHYQAHLPACPKDILRAFHIPTGNLVGVCLTAYPVLRCKLREDVFGFHSPHVLNKHFTQLVRLIVHPKHRQHGIADTLLKQIIRQTNTTVIEAINLPMIPDTIFLRCGMHKVTGELRNYYYAINSTKKPGGWAGRNSIAANPEDAGASAVGRARR